MSKQIKITTPGRVVVYDEDNTPPFWLKHPVALVVIGLITLVGGIAGLAFTDWGRATLVWLGLGLGLVVAAWLFRGPWRSLRAGEPASVWAGEALSAFGWGAEIFLFLAGTPYVFWRGLDTFPEWAPAVAGMGIGLFTAIAFLGVRLQLRRPLPALDRTPRSARVLFNTDDAEGEQDITLRYRGIDGKDHDPALADLIDDSWRDRFAPGTTWQVYAFGDPKLADTVVFLTEAHDDIWRKGYKLNGVRLGGESGPVTPPGPGSPFFRADSKWVFES
ncbi:hypothetical protein [Streptomyces sp. NPDC050560]|uniref:hypothetical protein n=1 Tax=Streptomyces sp. NPDC050560 TaxID=3365630 RepID=UPI0037AD848A